MTPEGRIKDQVKKILANYGDELDAFWPVQNGMGSPALDCIICYKGQHVEIETKAPGKKPTPRQEITMAKKRKAGSWVFVVDGSDEYHELIQHLDQIRDFCGC